MTLAEKHQLHTDFDRLAYEYAELCLFARSSDDHARRRAHRRTLLSIEQALRADVVEPLPTPHPSVEASGPVH